MTTHAYSFWARRRRSLQGWGWRLMGMVLGAIVAALMVAGLQVPLLHQPATTTATPVTLSSEVASSTLDWPDQGSAALDVPGLDVVQAFNNHSEPIASLTKMMTAYVVLQKMPLAIGQSGPCLTVNQDDVDAYDAMRASDQSSVAVAAGERLCEFTLLDGLLVHSASNYAAMLADFTWGSQQAFIAKMNQEAATLGLGGTHYADVSGFNDASVSTAEDQAVLAADLMTSPVVRSIVDQASVTLPVAGTVNSFTPYVGQDNVIGVKSGRTSAAGGCDVMAMTFTYDGHPEIAYAVVLDQRGGDLLTPAGNAALALATSATTSTFGLQLSDSTSFGSYGWGSATVPVVPLRSHVIAVPEGYSAHAALGATVTTALRAGDAAVRPGDVVGWTSVRTSWGTYRYALTVAAPVAPPSFWQRLR